MIWTDPPTVGDQAPSNAVRVNALDRDACLRDLEDRLVAGQGFCLATLNLDHVVKMRQSPDFRAVYGRQTHVTADGNPIVWLSRLAGQEVSLIPGSELIVPACEMAARCEMPVAFFGAREETLVQAKKVLEAQIPGLRVVSCLAPPMGFDPTGAQAQEYRTAIQVSGARLCFVALGAPKQETFAAFAASELSSVGFLSIGAGLDFIAGHQTRAPTWVRKLAAEWLWRMLSNPQRLAGRYWACLTILPGLVLRAMRTRAQGPSAS